MLSLLPQNYDLKTLGKDAGALRNLILWMVPSRNFLTQTRDAFPQDSCVRIIQSCCNRNGKYRVLVRPGLQK